jgi:hypothetical protein
MAEDVLINLTRPQFENLMETQGLANTVDGILSIANEELDVGDVPLTRETLLNGTHPLLDKLDRYKGLAPEQRSISDEEILTLFTNVKDFGKYDPSDDSFFSPGTKSVAGGAARFIPETIGAGAGFKGGLAAVTPIAAFIPPVGPGLLARGIVYGIGGIGGAILGSMAAGEAEDAIMGEAAPVVPSLEAQYRGGETGMFMLSMLASPWKLAPSIPKAKTGAIEWVENFKNVSSGKFTDVADEAFQLAARDAGMSEKAAAKLFEKARNARQIASERGQMFGGALGKDLGITKFNPAGYIFDPRKGPVGARAIAGIEGGIGRSMAEARDKTGRFLAAEGLVAGSAGLFAGIAQDAAPYDETARLYGELIGSLVIPIPAQLLVDSGPEFMRGVFRTMSEWYGKGTDKTAKDGLLRGALEKDVTKRIISAIQKSAEYEPRVNPETGEVIETAEEQLNRFIAELGKAAAVERKDADGKIYTLTVADLAKLEGLPFSATAQTIQQELAKSSADLRAATGSGRQELLAGAIQAYRALASTGDPAALAMAARVQQGLFEQNILDNVDGAVTNLTTAAGKVLGREPKELSQRTDLSEKLYDVLKNQIDLSKTRERRLWAEVKSYPLTEFYSRNGQQISQPNVLQLLGRPSSRGGLNFSSKGAQAELDAALGSYKADFDDLAKYFQDGQGRNPATAQKFFEMYSGLRNKAAQLRAPGRSDIVNAQRLDKINDALLRDLTGQRDGVSEAYNTARAYTFARNNVFTRSFLSDLQGVDRNRGLILDPQNLLDQAFRGGNLSTAKRFDQIRAAGRFLIDEAGFTEEAVRAMDADQLMSAALRDSLGKVMDKKSIPNPANPNEMIETFVVNPTKLENWKKQPGTKELYALIPDLEVDLANAQSAQRAFDGMLDDITLQMKPSEAARRGMTDEQLTNHYGTKAFQWVLQYEDPGKAVAQALAAEKPSLALNALYRMVNEADYKGADFTKEQAIQGLKSAIFNNALRKANNTAGLPNGDVLQRELFTQIPGVDPSVKLSVSDFLVAKGMATKDEMAEVQKMIKTIRGIDEAFATNNFENVLFKNPSMAKLFLVRIAGATAGAASQQQLKKFFGMPQMSGGLIAEQTGSDLIQRLLLRGPETQRIKVMTEMLANPKLFAAMAKEIQDAKMKDDLLVLIEKIMAPLARQGGRRLPIGIRAIDEDLTEEYEAPEQPTPPPAPVRQPTLPPANQQGALVPPAQTPTQGGGAAPSPVQAASAAPRPTPSTPSGPVDRARFAALFPEDRDLMGIASLAGQG